jgi:multicomponent Na+:H+ antiporter subunit A
MLGAVLAGLLAAPLGPLAARYRHGGVLLALVPLGIFIDLVRRSQETWSVSWAAGVELAFRLDGLSLLFCLLITGIGAFVFLYAGSYMQADPALGRLYAFLLVFMAAMLGLVLADDVVLLFIFWELTSISSYFLIGLRHEDAGARRSALQALLVTTAGGLALLAGLLLMGNAAGTWRISQMGGLQSAQHYGAILVLVLAGAFTKSAQVPFHFWLPNAMSAPSPISAYLHSATMVKAGVYLLARLSPVLSSVPWGWALKVAGATTMVVGAAMALGQRDHKRMLAYSTLSALGTLTLLLGVGTVYAVQAAVVFLLAHALYKAALFLVAGAVDHETGTRDLDRLSGLRGAMPVTAAAAALAALSLAGLGPLLSFIGKELVFEALLQDHVLARPVLLAATLTTGMFLAAVAYVAGLRPFLGAPQETPRRPHEAPWQMLAGPVILAGAGLALGLAPRLLEGFVVGPAASSILGEPVTAKLSLWHGLNAALGMSVVALLGGAFLVWQWRHLHRTRAGLEPLARWGPDRGYDVALAGIRGAAARCTRMVQHGNLRGYVATILAFGAGLSALALYASSIPVMWRAPANQPHEALLFLLLIAGAALAVTAKGRLSAILGLGMVGYAIAVVFILYGAPDLAMTQFLFETLMVLLVVLVLRSLPLFTTRSRPAARARDAVFAAAVGAVAATLVLLATATQFAPPISDYFGRWSYELGHGRNVVNVILVDFRALDTLGEITVLAAAALGAYAMLRLGPRGAP